jgi:hypothetical protein
MNPSLLFPNLSPEASAFLLGLASGKYDAGIAGMDEAFSIAGSVFPQALVAREIVDGLLALNKATAPVSVVPDGQGGYVPSNNSRFDPATGEFL